MKAKIREAMSELFTYTTDEPDDYDLRGLDKNKLCALALAVDREEQLNNAAAYSEAELVALLTDGFDADRALYAFEAMQDTLVIEALRLINDDSMIDDWLVEMANIHLEDGKSRESNDSYFGVTER